MKIDTPRQTEIKTNRALFEAILNLTFLNEKVGKRETISIEIKITQKTTING